MNQKATYNSNSTKGIFLFSLEKTISKNSERKFLYEKDNHLGNVHVVVSDRKLTVDDGVYDINGNQISTTPDGIIDYFEADVLASYDYYAGIGMVMPGRSFDNGYRYGAQGSEVDGEIQSDRNHINTYFREGNLETGQWWSLDPKPSAGVSPYAMFNRNPVLYNDVLGDTVKTNQEGFNIINEGLTATLGNNNPFSYNNDKGIVAFNQDFDRSQFSEQQLGLIDDFGSVVTSDKTTTVNVVDFNENISLIGGRSLKGNGLLDNRNNSVNGATTKDGRNVFIARNPQKIGDVSNPKYNPLDINSEEFVPGFINSPNYTRGVSSLHEIGGHVRLRFFSPQLSQTSHLELTEQFETNFRQFYRIGTYETKGQVRKANKGGLRIVIGDPKFLGGEAERH